MHKSQAGFGSREQIELEADHFAAGLLMPSDLVKQEAGRYSDGLVAIERGGGKMPDLNFFFCNSICRID